VSNAQIALNPSIFKPDSAIYYADSLENERYMLMINKYDGDSIDMAVYWYDSDTINYANKTVYYMDSDLPELPYEPIFSGGRQGGAFIGSGSYVYTSTIGDTLSRSYLYDFDSKFWVSESTVKHNISENGIDTLAITHSWNNDSQAWELNNVSKQYLIEGELDTLLIVMLAPNLIDTMNYDRMTYKFNQDNDIEILTHNRLYPDGTVDKYISKDSITYTEPGLIDFIYYGNNNNCANMSLPDCDNQIVYDYAEQYFYDSEGRLDKIYFWDKQGLPEWTFAGSFQYYYTNQPTNSTEKNFEDSFNIYPIPCKNLLTIESYTGNLEIYNSKGQLIKTEQLENGGLINTSFLQVGIYIIKFENGNSKLITKQ
jgi:hypothetical protein